MATIASPISKPGLQAGFNFIPETLYAAGVTQYFRELFCPPRDLPLRTDVENTRLFTVKRIGSNVRRVYERRDVEIINDRGLRLRCSHFVPSEDPACTVARPCVVYLHGMAASRWRVQDLLPFILSYDVSVFSVDFAGSGQSEGDNITLGLMEARDDLPNVMRYLQEQPLVTSIGIWGFSMGAVAAIIGAAERESGIVAAILDSPFADFRALCQELGRSYLYYVPQSALDVGWELVRMEGLTQAHFDPDELTPIKQAPSAKCPAMFLAAEGDELVAEHHVRDLHAAWGGEKQIRVVRQQGPPGYESAVHNLRRPGANLQEAAAFLCSRLGCPPLSAEDAKEGMTLIPLDSTFKSFVAKISTQQPNAGFDRGTSHAMSSPPAPPEPVAPPAPISPTFREAPANWGVRSSSPLEPPADSPCPVLFQNQTSAGDLDPNPSNSAQSVYVAEEDMLPMHPPENIRGVSGGGVCGGIKAASASKNMSVVFKAQRWARNLRGAAVLTRQKQMQPGGDCGGEPLRANSKEPEPRTPERHTQMIIDMLKRPISQGRDTSREASVTIHHPPATQRFRPIDTRSGDIIVDI